MNGKELLDRAAQRAQELPTSTLSQPFGEDWDVWKVGGKVFMLCTEVKGPAMITVKARPSDGRQLCDAYADINPGYHMNKKHWITITPNGTVDPELLDDLIAESYLLVVEGLPRRARPVNPDTFGS
ncbi:MmcQ/YjbR family DNA-binding protein [Schaalia vaccimaxillae]|uniref:MmcQ/YjbR family DNA-binding protein n=1 Tax=Schaalia vaccimaxillae TaxID=183916 RepID=UPI000409F8FE|nr:MmcQ/YjbR family DNA-binding protein [Schaalia vaccimaxillae]